MDSNILTHLQFLEEEPLSGCHTIGKYQNLQTRWFQALEGIITHWGALCIHGLLNTSVRLKHGGTKPISEREEETPLVPSKELPVPNWNSSVILHCRREQTRRWQRYLKCWIKLKDTGKTSVIWLVSDFSGHGRSCYLRKKLREHLQSILVPVFATLGMIYIGWAVPLLLLHSGNPPRRLGRHLWLYRHLYFQKNSFLLEAGWLTLSKGWHSFHYGSW